MAGPRPPRGMDPGPSGGNDDEGGYPRLSGGYPESAEVPRRCDASADDPMLHLSLFAVALLGPSQFDFPEAQFPMRVGVAEPVAGKLDADPLTDVVAVDRSRSELVVARGLGDGAFAPPTAHPTGSEPLLVRLSDLDGDGDLDALVAWVGGVSGGFSVHLGDGQGGFAAPAHRALPWRPADFVVGDLDGDGRADLVFVGAAPHDAEALAFLGDGSGGFGAGAASPLGAAVVSIALGDLDGDPHPDLFTGAPGPSSVRVYSGSAAGSFTFATSIALPQAPAGLAVGDLDGDGADDVAVVAGFGFPFPATLSTFLGDGAGGFAPAATYPAVAADSHRIDLLDCDGDGALDAVVGWRVSTLGGVSVHPGLGTGSFGTPQSVVGKTWFEGFTVADLGAGAGIAVLYLQGGQQGVTPLGFLGVVKRTSTGSFQTPHVERFGVWQHDGRSLVALDVDGDGFEDIVTLGSASPWQVLSVHRGDGTGGFSGHWRLAFPAQNAFSIPDTLLLGHLDGDGFVDAIGVEDGMILFFRGTPGGRFAAPLEVGQEKGRVALADLDGDGVDELIVGRWVATSNTDVSVLVLVGSQFVQVSQTTVPWRVSAITAADFDADARVDLALAAESSPWIGWLRGNGDFTFAPLQQLATPDHAGALAAVDLDGDGLLELVASVPAFHSVLVWPSLGGTFGSPVRRAVGGSPGHLASADFDGDGFLDVVVSNAGTDNIAILAGNPATLIGRPQFFARPPWQVASLVAFQPAAGLLPDVVLTTAGNPMTGNYEVFYQLENLAP